MNNVIHFVTVALLTAHSFAQTVSEYSELSSLRTSWTKAREQVTLPVDKKYEAALVAMKDRLTKAGNLEAAIQVDAELKKLTVTNPPSASQTAPQTTQAPSFAGSFKSDLGGAVYSLVVDAKTGKITVSRTKLGVSTKGKGLLRKSGSEAQLEFETETGESNKGTLILIGDKSAQFTNVDGIAAIWQRLP